MRKFIHSKTQIDDYDDHTRILIVDSDELIAKFFKIHLNKYFSKVFVMEDPKEAFSMFKSNPFHLVILDANQSQRNGFDLAKQIRQLNEKTPMILMSNQNQQEKDKSLYSGFLKKPFTVEEFHLSIKDAIHKNLKLSEKAS